MKIGQKVKVKPPQSYGGIFNSYIEGFQYREGEIYMVTGKWVRVWFPAIESLGPATGVFLDYELEVLDD